MIELDITNFQNIAKASFKIEGLTCVVGESNIGKTSLCRALHCLVANPPAAGYIRHGASEARVKATFPKQRVAIEWIRTKSGARYVAYHLDDSGKVTKTTKYDKPGRGTVPDPIRKLKFLVLDTDDVTASIGYADQHHYSFLIDDPKMTVQLTGELQAIARLSKAMKQVRSEVRTEKGNIQLQEQLIARAEGQIKRLEGSEALADKLKVLEEQEAGLDKQRKRLDSLRLLGTRLSDIQARGKALKQILQALQGADQLGGKIDALGDQVSQVGSLRNRMGALKSIQQRKEKAEQGLQAVQVALKTVDRVPDCEVSLDRLQALQRLSAGLKSIQDRGRALKKVKSTPPQEAQMEELADQIKAWQDRKALARKASELLTDLKNNGRILEQLDFEIEGATTAISEYIASNPECPECGQALPSDL